MKQIGKLVMGLAIVLVMSGLGCAQNKDNASLDGEKKDIVDVLNDAPVDLEHVKVIGENTLVDLVVILDDKPLSDFGSDYFLTEKGVKKAKEIEENQNSVKEEIKKMNLLYQPVFDYSYNMILSGFSVSCAYKDIKKITNLEEVKGVYLSKDYYLDEEMVDYKINATGETGDDIMGKAGMDSEFDGTGTTISIIDTGLWMNHEAFSDANFDETTMKITSGDIDAVRTTLSAYSLNHYVTTNSLVGGRNKVIYAYDYADNDTDVNPNLDTMSSTGNYHGTHVAGLAAGDNGVDFFGIAPEAQLTIMKVFGDDSSGASTVDILAAIDDSVKLGVDVINMSLGSSSGYYIPDEFSYGSTLYREIEYYDRVTEAGITLCVSAGNDYNDAYASYYGAYGNLDYVDLGLVGSPSTYASSLSIASSDLTLRKYQFKSNGQAIDYNEGVYGQSYLNFMNMFNEKNGYGTFSYVDCGMGLATDFSSASGKIALVGRGSQTFDNMYTRAVNAGAIGLIVYNSSNDPFNPVITIDGELPIAAISLDDGEALKGYVSKQIAVALTNFKDVIPMSEFSSYGPVSDANLILKPELTAPGGEVYSTYPSNTNDSYVLMSGTSMAAPNASGAAACLRQYVKSLGITDNKEIADMVYKLSMSTANALSDEDGNIYSPRKQGAGLVDLSKATTTKAYLEVENSDRVKIELESDNLKTGEYSFGFSIVNTGSTSMTYNLRTLLLLPRVSANGFSLLESLEENYISFTASKLSGNGLVSGTSVAVSANSSIELEISFALSSDVISFFDNFTYGTYVEGYVFLDGDVDLSIPYLGYYGNYSERPILDNFVWDEKNDLYSQKDGFDIAYQYASNTGVSSMKPSEIDELYFGTDVSSYLETNKISINGSTSAGLGSISTHYFSLLRNCDAFKVSLYDKTANREIGSGLYDDVFVGSSNYDPYEDAFYSYELDYSDVDIKADYGTYFYNNMELSIRYSLESGSYVEETELCINIDLEKPVVLDYSFYEDGGSIYMLIETYDNMFTYGVEVGTYTGTTYTKDICVPVNQKVSGTNALTVIDVTDYFDTWNESGVLGIKVYDFALNEKDYKEAFRANSLVALDESFTTIYDENLNTGINTLTASGNMTINNGVLEDYSGSASYVVIPNTVVEINDDAFRGSTTLKYVYIPSSVKRIGSEAFFGCRNLACVYYDGIEFPSLISKTRSGTNYIYRNFTNNYSSNSIPSSGGLDGSVNGFDIKVITRSSINNYLLDSIFKGGVYSFDAIGFDRLVDELPDIIGDNQIKISDKEYVEFLISIKANLNGTDLLEINNEELLTNTLNKINELSDDVLLANNLLNSYYNEGVELTHEKYTELVGLLADFTTEQISLVSLYPSFKRVELVIEDFKDLIALDSSSIAYSVSEKAKSDYEALSAIEKELVYNSAEGLARIQEVESVKTNEVMILIDKLPNANLITITDKAAVMEARNNYSLLSAEEKLEVTNLDRLVAAEIIISKLESIAVIEAEKELIEDAKVESDEAKEAAITEKNDALAKVEEAEEKLNEANEELADLEERIKELEEEIENQKEEIENQKEENEGKALETKELSESNKKLEQKTNMYMGIGAGVIGLMFIVLVAVIIKKK